MLNISFYLERFKDLKDPGLVKKSIISTIEQEIGSTLEDSSVVFEKGVVTIKSDALLRNQIFMQQEGIIEKLKLNNINVSNIV